MKVRQILAIKGMAVFTIRPQQQVRDAVGLLVQHNIGALVVVDEDGNTVGIISERDVIRTAHENENVFSLQVADIMTRKVITGIPQDDLSSVANTMTERHIRHLPIVEDGRLVGIISIGDILKAQRDAYRGEIDTLEAQIIADES